MNAQRPFSALPTALIIVIVGVLTLPIPTHGHDCVDYRDFIDWSVGITTPGDARDVALVGDLAYVADGSDGLQIFDVSDPSAPFHIGGVDTPGDAIDVAVAGTLALVADRGGGLQIIDVSNPHAPTVVGNLAAQLEVFAVAVAGDLAYIADGIDGEAVFFDPIFTDFMVVDISSPQAPTIVGTMRVDTFAFEIALEGNLAFLVFNDCIDFTCFSGGVHVVDIADASAPAVIGTVNTLARARDVETAGTLAFLAVTDALIVIDASTPDNPRVISETALGGGEALVLSGNLAFSTGVTVNAVDISDPTSPVVLGRAFSQGSGTGIAVGKGSAFVVDQAGLQVVNIENPLSTKPVSELATSQFSYDIETSGGFDYIVSHSGPTSLLEIVDVTTPVPMLVGSVVLPDDAWGVTVAGDKAYIGAAGAGLVIVDVSNPQLPTIVGSVPTPRLAWDVVVQGTRAYVAEGLSGTGGLAVVDVSNPTSPVVIGTTASLFGFARDVAVSGTHAYVVNQTGLNVYSVFNPSSPILIAIRALPSSGWGVKVEDGFAYVATRADGLQILDVSNPGSPVIVGSVPSPGRLRDVTLLDGFAYAVGTELLIVDISDPTQPQRVASEVITPDISWGIANDGSLLHVILQSARLEIRPTQCPLSPPVAVDLPVMPRGVSVVMGQNAPNPFKLDTRIWFTLPETDEVSLHMYDVLGRQIRSLVSRRVYPAGTHSVHWDGRDDRGRPVGSGTFFYRLDAGDATVTRQAVMIK